MAISPELAFASNFLDNSGSEYKEKDGVLYRWIGSHWEVVAIGEIEKQALNWLAEEVAEKCNTRMAASCASTAIMRASSLPSASHAVIPVLNGYLHFEGSDIVLKPHDKAIGVTYCLDCNFDKDARAVKFESFLEGALPDSDIRSYLQEYSGYTLQSDCRHQIGCWLIGGGGNGKSTFAQVMQALHRKPVSMQLDALEGFNLAGLVGASLVYCDETPARIDEQKLKTLISGDSVQIDRKYRDPIVIRPVAKWIVSGNALPAISDHSDGFWRRWFVVPFNTKPKTIQPLLGDIIIKEELSGVLNWALAGLQRLIARNDTLPPMPAAMLLAQKTGKQQSNSVAAWVSDCDVNITSDKPESRKMMYHYYVQWCKINGMKSVSAQKFWERLGLNFGTSLKYSVTNNGGRRTQSVNLIVVDLAACFPVGYDHDVGNEVPPDLPV
ncbi:MAG: phage/plasmid primase, P4 family [Gallionella sp.]|jgi:putative DNA primase/helicase